MTAKASLTPDIEKLESLFSKMNKTLFCDELQTPVITISPDTTRGAYGWCTTWRAWCEIDRASIPAEKLSAEKENGFYEITICAEYLARPFENIVETLLHEMVHLYNLQNGVNDVSRHGYYHNKKFKEAAEQHGLIVEKTSSYGWSETRLNTETKHFVSSLQNKKFWLYRKTPTKISGTSHSKQSNRKYVCPNCGCIVRATKVVHIICGECNVPFTETE